MPCFVSQQHAHRSPYDAYPSDQDGFHFMPCTERAVLPALDDLSPLKTWQSRFDPNPEHWSWGPAPNKTHSTLELQKHDRYGDRGIFLCGYMDLPMDYTNKSDQRIVRLAVTKYQVSGLALRRPRSPRFWRRSGNVESTLRRGVKSAQTLVGEPGGPGGSGTSFAWRVGPDWSARRQCLSAFHLMLSLRRRSRSLVSPRIAVPGFWFQLPRCAPSHRRRRQ